MRDTLLRFASWGFPIPIRVGGSGIRILDPASRTVTGFDGGISAPINFDIDVGGSIWAVTRSTQVFDTKGLVLKIRYPAGESPTRMAAGGEAAAGVMRWRAGAEGLDVETFHGGPQGVSLRTLEGRAVVTQASAGKVRIRLETRNLRGVHLLVWRAGIRTAVAKLSL
jgi:hypothetical protein